LGRTRPFSQEFKDEAVRMVLDGPRPVAHVAREIGVHDTTLGNWVAAYKRRHGGQAPGAAEIKTERECELERENRKLREENEFLKKAAAFFAAENR
jgi:transposase